MALHQRNATCLRAAFFCCVVALCCVAVVTPERANGCFGRFSGNAVRVTPLTGERGRAFDWLTVPRLPPASPGSKMFDAFVLFLALAALVSAIMIITIVVIGALEND